jgi:hypothetical protein|tara:strand:- start:403 stop:816 length:414 start_codon:yes stop_codon:yes gene_type:complete
MSEEKKNGMKTRKKLKRNKRKNNIVPFDAKKNLRVASSNENPQIIENVEEVETARINADAKKMCQEVIKCANSARISSAMVYYHFLFHLKQVAIMNLNYGEYKHLDHFTSKELAENHGEFLSSHSELWKKEDIKKLH